jgi:hypothetical protein
LSPRSNAKIYRQRRALVATALLSVVIVIAVIATSSGGGHKSKPKSLPPAATASHPARKPIAAIEAGLLPWPLSTPLSREAVLPGAGDSLVVAGGLTAPHRPSSMIFNLSTPGGSATVQGTLPTPTYDAAGGQLSTGDLLVGGAAAS